MSDHVAILRKSNIKSKDNLLGDILAGTKTIESRWYVNKVAPWGKVFAGDTVYFKESGQPVTASALVSKVLQFEDLNRQAILEIIDAYGTQIAPNTSREEFISWTSTKPKIKYCILVFLKDVKKLQPFQINKKGFGISSAWLAVGDIEKVKIS